MVRAPGTRTWSFLAPMALAAALLLGVGSTSPPSNRVPDERARLAQPALWPGALQAVLRTDVARVAGVVSTKDVPTAGLLGCLAISLCAVGLLSSPRAARGTRCSDACPTVTRVRLGVGMRAPPSSTLV